MSYASTAVSRITATAGGNFTMLTSPGSLSDEFFTEGGAVALTAGAGATMTLNSDGATAVSSSGGNVTLTSDFLNIGKAVNAGSDNVLIQPVTAGEQISLGGAATGGLSLTNAELDDITAKTITIGNSSAGEVSLAGTISPTSGTNLTINTGSGVLANGATINLGSGVLTIGFDEAGAGATANLTGATITASMINVIGGAASDTSNFVNNGTLNVLSGSIEFSGGFTNNGVIHGLVRQSGGVTTVSAPVPCDFNGDALSDILWRGANGDAQIWNSNGSGSFSDRDLGVVGNSYQIVATADFNGDGKADILWRKTNGGVELWNSNGSGGFAYDNLGAVNPSWQIAGTGDFTGDGEDGILWRNSSTGDVELWNSNGSGGFTYHDLGVVFEQFQDTVGVGVSANSDPCPSSL
jgi:hypothetical protein